MNEASAVVYQSLSEYFTELDALDSAARLSALFTDDAVWECYDRGEDKPLLSFQSKAGLEKVLEVAKLDAGGTALRHHLTGLAIETASSERIQASAKVLITAQAPGKNEPVLRNTARCRGEWRRDKGAWRIARWEIRRDSKSLPPRRESAEPAQVVRGYFREIVDGRGDQFNSFFTPDCMVHRCELGAPLIGIAELARFFRGSRELIVRQQTSIEDLFSDGNRVAARVRHQAVFGGTLLTPLGKRDVRGKQVEWTAMAWFELAGGLISREWVQRDEVGIYRQLGIIDEIQSALGASR